MSAVKQLRRKVGYEGDTPRCCSCVHYKRPGMMLINSLPRAVPPWCKLHEFRVGVNGLCNTWAGTNGDVLA